MVWCNPPPRPDSHKRYDSSDLDFSYKQGARDFALRFIESHNPANAQEIAAAAIEFTGGDDV